MLTLILVLAVLCLAVIAGPHLADHQGFVHIVAGDYVIECSLTTAVIVILVGCALLYLVLSLIAYFLSMPGGISRWLGRHGLRKSRSPCTAPS